ncbi:MAG: CsgG/HfaB family protein [Elusimicrobiales bacterium]|nr:CsgG/HfaB family protein [Elusimicrobiales bacterium]
MKTVFKTRISAALALVCALSFPAAGAEAYRSLSLRIAKCAAENSMKKIAVLDFAAKGGAERSETSYVAEKMGVQLAGSKAVSLIERALLEKVLKEAGLSAAAGGSGDNTEVLKNVLSVDAVVTGVVFADGETLRVFARLIDIKTGRVLLAAEAAAGRLSPPLPGGRLMNHDQPAEGGFPGSSVPRTSFRDALSDFENGSCAGKKSLVIRLNSELVDAKARFWAMKMGAPGFSRQSLTGNPGSEIKDPEVKTRFYRLLAAYYKDSSAARLAPEERSEVADLLKLETRISEECGFR